MNMEKLPAAGGAAIPIRKISRDAIPLVGDLIPFFDYAGVLLAAWIATLLYVRVTPAALIPAGIWHAAASTALAAALMAPLILCDRAFVLFAGNGQTGPLVRCYAVRFLMFAGVVAAIGMVSHAFDRLPGLWLLFWFAFTLTATMTMRGLLIANLRNLESLGILRETIALVGTGPGVELLLQELRRAGNRVEVVGVFDDLAGGTPPAPHKLTGSIADLVELGKTRAMDWIILAPSGAVEHPVAALVHRLKALAFPIALYSHENQKRGRHAVHAHRLRWESTPAALSNVLPSWLLKAPSLLLAHYLRQGLRRLSLVHHSPIVPKNLLETVKPKQLRTATSSQKRTRTAAFAGRRSQRAALRAERLPMHQYPAAEISSAGETPRRVAPPGSPRPRASWSPETMSQ